MDKKNVYEQLLDAATPLFATRGLHGTRIRDVARAAGINLSMISYHFGGKEGLYAEVLREQFSALALTTAIAETAAAPDEKFATYLYECGVCFHCGSIGEFEPKTASADRGAPECPRCLTNDASVIASFEQRMEKAS